MFDKTTLQHLFTEEQWEDILNNSFEFQDTGFRIASNIFFCTTMNVVDKEKIAIWRMAFLTIGDSTEYLFGQLMCGDWEVYTTMKGSSSILRKALEKWKEELDIKQRSDAMQVVISKSKDDATTAKWLVEGKHKAEAKKVGRPKKENNEAKIKAAVWDTVEDYDKILKEVN